MLIVSWPLRLPDLTPIDFYVWGYYKMTVKIIKVQSRKAESEL